MDWDYVFAQLKRFYRCTKAEFKAMTLYEVFQLLEDGERLIKTEIVKGTPSEGSTSSLNTADKKRLIQMAKERDIELPGKGL